jgi:hypothetical protein
MPSQSTSKAQRRSEAQQRAAEKRAAELRAKRAGYALRGGGVLVLVAVIVIIVLVVTGGSKSIPPSLKNPKVATVAIPSSMKTVPAPKEKAGPETVGLPASTATKLADLSTVATGQTVDGIQCQDGEQTVTHVHTHLTIFVNGKQKVIPYGIGIPGFTAVQTPEGPFVETGSCFYWLHTHADDGIIHIESPSTSLGFTLSQFFAEWGQPLSSTQVGPDKGVVTTFFNGKLYKGNPATLPLCDHYQIQLDVGTPIVAPYKVTSWGGL